MQAGLMPEDTHYSNYVTSLHHVFTTQLHMYVPFVKNDIINMAVDIWMKGVKDKNLWTNEASVLYIIILHPAVIININVIEISYNSYTAFVFYSEKGE